MDVMADSERFRVRFGSTSARTLLLVTRAEPMLLPRRRNLNFRFADDPPRTAHCTDTAFFVNSVFVWIVRPSGCDMLHSRRWSHF